MRTGVIVYMLDKNFPVENEPELAAAVKARHQADRVEVVSRDQKHFDVMDAWWKLTAKGMQRFVFMFLDSPLDSTNKPSRNHLRVVK